MKLGRIVYIYWWQLTKIMVFLNTFCTKKQLNIITLQGIFFSFVLYLIKLVQHNLVKQKCFFTELVKLIKSPWQPFIFA